MVRVYLFTDIPGSGKDWTLAVFATSKQDAVNYVKRADGGGRFVGEVQPGKIDACCGAVTELAEIEMKRSDNGKTTKGNTGRHLDDGVVRVHA